MRIDQVEISVPRGTLTDECEELASRDPRLELRYVVDGQPSRVDLGSCELRALFVRYLVPRWIDIQSHDATS